MITIVNIYKIVSIWFSNVLWMYFKTDFAMNELMALEADKQPLLAAAIIPSVQYLHHLLKNQIQRPVVTTLSACFSITLS